MIFGRAISIGGLVSGIAFALTGIIQQVPVLLLSGAICFGISVFACSRLFFTRVAEHEALVLQNKVTGEFSRYLSSGLHLLDFYEVLDYRFSTHPRVIDKEIGGLRSADGIAHKVTYTVEVEPRLSTIPPDGLASQLHVIAYQFRTQAHLLIEKSLRHTMGKFNAEELSQGKALTMLERHFRADIERRFLKAGIKATRLSIRSIDPPREFKKSLVEAKTRLIEAEYVSLSIQRIQMALSQLSESEKQLMGNWEIMRLLNDSNNPIFYSLNTQAKVPQAENNSFFVNPYLADSFSRPFDNRSRRAH